MQAFAAGIVLLGLWALLTCPGAAASEFYVAPGGDDANEGTREAPFASLEGAREAVRLLKGGYGLPAGGITVILRGGVYPRESTFELTAQDSGAQNARVTWRVQEGEEARLVGGVEVGAEAFSAVEDPAVLQRLDEAARGNVLRADLRALGITEWGEFPDRFRGAPTAPEVFFADERMDLARWPNEGWAEVEEVVRRGARPRSGEPDEEPGIIAYEGDRPARWDVERGVWLNGYWCYDWYIEALRVAEIDTEQRHITFVRPHWYGIGGGNPGPRRFFAFNLLEELTRPGEYYIDREQGVLYLWPPAPVEQGRVVVSTLSSPVISVQEASHVTLRGLTVEMCMGNAIEMRGGSDNRLEACVVRNTGHGAVVVQGGERHTVEACNIHDTGTAGLRISGGDRQTLAPCGHEVLNNHIYRVSRRQRTHAYHIHMGGVGVRVAHNLLHDGPHQAIGLSGNEHLIEFNEIFRTGMETDDCGAFYMGRNMSERGTVIRHNFWHDIGSELTHGSCAVYFDDGAGGQVVFGNVFLRASGGRFGAIHIHGGHDNLIDNNIFIDCSAAMGITPWSDERWASLVRGWQQRIRDEVNVTRPPYSERYPDLVRFFTTDAEGNVVTIPGIVRVNQSTRNVAVRCGELLRERGRDSWQAWNNYVTEEDPGFVDAEGGNFALREDSVVFMEIEGFQSIPFERMGLYVDALRPALPGGE